MSEISIPRRFNGPSDSGNGGYCCGVLAGFIEGACRVRLHSPPPLDRPLSVRESQSGQVDLYNSEILVGSAIAATLELDIPAAPSLEEAERASKHFVWQEHHCYPTCFVCGPGRREEDGLGLSPGPLGSWDLLACSWQPAAEFLDEKGNIRPEIIWSALDCPGFFAAVGDSPGPMLLGELTAEILKPVPGADSLLVFSWPLGVEGRKYYGGVAIANSAGEVLACSRTTWIAPNS